MTKEKVLKIIGILLLLIVLITIPFSIEAIVYNETVFPFNISIKISREGWFSFLGSYLGAIGTVLLGALAIWQTKKYKKASDTTDETFQTLQEKIKELVQTNTELAKENKAIQESIKSIIEKNTNLVEISNGLQTDMKNLTVSNAGLQMDIKEVVDHIPELIENNSKIQEEVCQVMKSNKAITDSLLKIQTAIFCPRLTVLHLFELCDYGKLSERMDLENDAFANVVFSTWDGYDYGNWAEKFEGKCGYFAFPLYNDGEKDIISFKFEQMRIAGKKIYMSYITQSADIKAHQTVWCIFAVEKSRFEDLISDLTNQGPIKMDFSLSNTIGDNFIWSAALSVDEINDGECYFSLNYLGTMQIDSLYEWYKENK